MSDLDAVRQLVTDRFDALEQTLAARLETIEERRASGDQLLDGRVTQHTKDLGAVDSKIQRVEHDTNAALQSHREQLQETLHEELGSFAKQLRGSLADHQTRTGRVEERVEVIEGKLDAVKWAALGVGIGSGITSGGLVALINGTLAAGIG